MFSLLAATLSPVPEADDYESSDISLSDVVIRSSATTVNQSNKRQQQQPLIKSERRRNLSPQVNEPSSQRNRPFQFLLDIENYSSTRSYRSTK